MIPALLRQDPAIRGISAWLTLTAGVGTALLAALSMLLYAAAARGVPPDPGLHFSTAFAIIWFAMAGFLLSPGVRTRATDFTLGLPIGAHSLWIVHHFGVLLASLAVWGILAGMLLVGNRVVVGLGAPDIFPGEYALDLAIYAPAGFSLVIALLQAPTPELRTLPLSRRYTGWWIVTVFGILALTLALTRLPLVLAAVLPASAAAVLLWNRGRAPLTFLVAPQDAVAPGWTAGVADGAWVASARPHAGLSYRWFLFRTIHRAVAKKNALPIVGYPTLLVLGAALSGVFAVRTEENALRFDLIIISAYMILAFLGGLTANLHRMDVLPVSRRSLFAVLMVPTVLSLAAGYAVGLGVLAAGPPREQIRLHTTECCGPFLAIPTARCEIAWNGDAPAYAAPWGESHAAWSTPLYRGSTAILYSPFSLPEGGTRRYLAHQIRRATEAVYSRAVPEEEISSRYLDTDASGAVIPAAGGMLLAGDHPDLRARPEGPAFPVLMMLVCVPGFLLSAVYLRSFRAGVSEGRRNRVFWILLMVLLAAHLGQYVLFVTQTIRTWVFAGVFEIAIRKAGEAFPGSTAVVWGVCAVAAYLAYRVAERAFVRIEVVQKIEG